MHIVPQIRPTCAKINLSNLTYNHNIIRRLIPKNTKIVSVVKANAYGHGSIEIANTLVKAGTEYLGVATIEEGIELRFSGIRIPILILGSTYPFSSFQYLDEFNLIPTISSLSLAKKYAAYFKNAKKKNKKFPIHLKIDTGMGRIGMMSNRAIESIKKISNLPNIYIQGIYSHLAHAENDKIRLWQMKQLAEIKTKLAHISIPHFHIANSGGIIHHPHADFSMVRPGLALYGLYPPNKNISFKPVMSLKSKIVFLKSVPQGTGISYHHTYKTCKKSMLATVPIGYGDGLSRMLSNNGEGIVKGKRVPLIGRVCMDMCMFDVTNIKGVKIGDEITLIGKSGNEEITVCDIAKQTNTISYEVVCNISSRVPRVYA